MPGVPSATLTLKKAVLATFSITPLPTLSAGAAITTISAFHAIEFHSEEREGRRWILGFHRIGEYIKGR